MKILQKKLQYLVVAILLLLFVTPVKAQQDPMYAQYMHNMITVNPAYAGSNEMLSAMFLARKQWVGFPGAPETRVLTMNTPITQYNFGVGLEYINDQLGPVKNNSVYADLAYHLQVSENGILAMGLKAGADFMQLDLQNLRTTDKLGRDDPAFMYNYNKTLINFGLGFYYYTKRFYAGLSVPRLLENNLKDDDGVKVRGRGYQDRHYFFTTGALFDLSYRLKLKPSALVKAVWDAPLSVDVNAHFILDDVLWLGVGYRITNSFDFLIHYQVTPQLRIGYAYDLTAKDLRPYNHGTHEIMIAFDFQFDKKKVMTPRYF